MLRYAVALAISGQELGECSGDGGGEREDGGERGGSAHEGSGVGGAIDAGKYARGCGGQECEHDDQGGGEQDDGDVVHGDLPEVGGTLT